MSSILQAGSDIDDGPHRIEVHSLVTSTFERLGELAEKGGHSSLSQHVHSHKPSMAGAAAGAATGATPEPGTGTPEIPAGGDKFDQLIKMLGATEEGPKAEASAGLAPMPTNIMIKNPYAKDQRLQNYNYLQGMVAIRSLYTAIYSVSLYTKRGRKEPYSITKEDEAVQAFADLADSIYQAFQQPLAGFYNINVGAFQHFEKQMTQSEVHTGFLSEIFKGFKLGEDAITQLDGVLKNFMSAFGSVKVQTDNQRNTVTHAIVVDLVPKVNISGDEKDPEYVYVPTSKLIYMKIDAQSYKVAVSKWSGGGTTESFSFKMDYAIVEATLNVERYVEAKPKFDKIFNFVTGKNLDAFGAKTSNEVKSAD